MVSDKFRRQLRQEAEAWWHDGLIDAKLYEQLAGRYQFKALESEAQNRFVVILIGLGSILLGLGVITYVAANWQGWPREFRTLLLLSLFVAVNVAGFYLWRRAPSSRGQRLGHGLLLLGALILGANMGLMSQMFHQSGNLYELYVVWSLGVLAMAYGLRLSSLGILALILMGIGYCLGIMNWVAGPSSGWRIVLEQMPLIVGGLWLPLAYWSRSKVMFGLVATAVSLALMVNLGILTSDLQSAGLLALTLVLPIGLLWAYSDRIWPWLPASPTLNRSLRSPTQENTERFRPISRGIAGVQLSLLLYWLSFHWLWEGSLLSTGDAIEPDSLPLLFSIVILTAIALWGWVLLLKQGLKRINWPLCAINSITLAVTLGVIALTILGHEGGEGLPFITTLVFNILLFLFSLGLIRDGLAVGHRGLFWGGMVLLVISIMSRMLEYNTDLLLKALAFALCGVGVIGAGIWFERQLKPSQETR